MEKVVSDPSHGDEHDHESSNSNGDDILLLVGQKSPLYRQSSSRISSAAVVVSAAVAESLPETPVGWTLLLATSAAAVFAYEMAIQRQLTAPPLVYGQVLQLEDQQTQSKLNNNGSATDAWARTPIAQVYQTMKSQPNSIITRPIQPSLLVGTRATLSSAMAYWSAGPKAREEHVQFREILNLPADGAQVALDWELPRPSSSASSAASALLSVAERKHQVLHGPIAQPVVLILHGINNHAGFGYIQSMMRACTDRGWIAAGFNFRGCTVPLQTPRIYNGAYTGDLRSVVQYLSRRFVVPPGRHHRRLLFLVGNSLGANLVAKYLGEEGRCGSLPDCVAGGVTMGNPMRMTSGEMNRFYSPIIAMGAKRGLLSVLRSTLWGMCQTQHYRDCIRHALLAPTLEAFDEALAPIFVRNDPDHPFALKVGYHPHSPQPNGGSTGGAAQAYGWDASSYRQVPFVSVPLLQLIAKDDFLVFSPFNSKLAYNLCNPNVMVMETTCGGHLGWHEAHPNGGWGGSSWADTAVVDFIQAVLDIQQNQEHPANVDFSETSDRDTVHKRANLRQQQRTVKHRLAQNTELRSRL